MGPPHRNAAIPHSTLHGGGQPPTAANGADMGAPHQGAITSHKTPRSGEETSTAANGAEMGIPHRSATINIHIPLMTDNQGNAHAVLNHNTKKWPCSAILMEICAQAHTKDCHPAIQHVKRDRNTWADQLSNLDFDGFDPGLRIDIN